MIATSVGYVRRFYDLIEDDGDHEPDRCYMCSNPEHTGGGMRWFPVEDEEEWTDNWMKNYMGQESAIRSEDWDEWAAHDIRRGEFLAQHRHLQDLHLPEEDASVQQPEST